MRTTRGTQLSVDVPAVDFVDSFGDPDGVVKFSSEWRERHRDWWISMYPDIDPVSRANLEMLVEQARAREAAVVSDLGKNTTRRGNLTGQAAHEPNKSTTPTPPPPTTQDSHA